MTIAYFDCFAGAGGDMIVASLVDAGADFAALQAQLARFGAAGFSLRTERVRRGGLAGLRFCVDIDDHGEHAHRGLADILTMLDAAALSARATDRAKRVFTRLAEAEAKVHGTGVEEVHFHEIGAIDSIADIVGACVAMELLGIEQVYCSPIPVGQGTIRCAHGVLPVPAPATARLLVGAKTVRSELEGEVTTPTAAALLTTLAESFGPMPAMEVSAVGWGAGTHDRQDVPNLLRVFVGRGDNEGEADSVVELSANLDDCTGEVIGAAIEKLLAAGCLDACAAPILMKKSRPAWMISVLCRPEDVERAEDILFAETTTLGVRRRPAARTKLRREHRSVETLYGPISVKVGLRGDRVVTASPEFAECRQAAESHHVAVREVLAAAQEAFRQGRFKGPGR